MPWSPPVPTVSTVLGRSDETFAAAWRLARAAAANHPSAKVVVLAPAALPERLGADAGTP